jgi:MFS superfamily sulfate permease-like transporter
MDLPDAKEVSVSWRNFVRHDCPAGLVVFLVALPLCLGIALGSGAPLFSGVISGIAGGLVVTLISESPVSVSGPAAGLAVIVLTAIGNIGSFRGFLVAVVLSGVMQCAFGALKLGFIGDYVPHSTIKGMLAGIGVLIILKQIPHALGRDKDYLGDFRFLEVKGNNTLSDIASSVASAAPGAVIIFVLSVAVLITWNWMAKRYRLFQLVPGALIVVALGIFLNQAYGRFMPSFQLTNIDHLVNLPVSRSFGEFIAQFTLPDFSMIGSKAVWTSALMIAVVGSLESLLSLEAADRLDPYKRLSSTNRELFAQGIGNIASGLVGGIPVTSVVVRSAANVGAGVRTWLGAFTHGALLLVAVILLPGLLRLAPLCGLATILIMVGYQLTPPSLYREMFAQGWDQFIPFIVTAMGVVFIDLLTGVIIGVICGVFFVVRTNHHEGITVVNKESDYLFQFTKNASFINKNEFRRKLRELPDGASVLIDGTRALYIDHDIMETLQDFQHLAPYKNIRIELKHWESA